MTEPAELLTPRLTESLYAHAMLLADETRAHFDRDGLASREALAPELRVMQACEALKGTTRLMQVIAWLLTRRAIDAGELSAGGADAGQRRLGEATAYRPVPGLPPETLRLLSLGAELYDRVARLDRAAGGMPVDSPARALQRRLERSL